MKTPLGPLKSLNLFTHATVTAPYQIMYLQDLKPQNFMKVKGRVKLIDFGISQTIADADMTSMIVQQPEGTPNYISPEVWCIVAKLPPRAPPPLPQLPLTI